MTTVHWSRGLRFARDYSVIDIQHRFARWARTQDSPESAWQNCENPVWMFHAVPVGAPGGTARQRLGQAASACVRLALPVFDMQFPGDPVLRDFLAVLDSGNRAAIHVGQYTRDHVDKRAWASQVNFHWYGTHKTDKRVEHAAALAINAGGPASGVHDSKPEFYVRASAASAADITALALGLSLLMSEDEARRACADVVRRFYPEFPRDLIVAMQGAGGPA